MKGELFLDRWWDSCCCNVMGCFNELHHSPVTHHIQSFKAEGRKPLISHHSKTRKIHKYGVSWIWAIFLFQLFLVIISTFLQISSQFILYIFISLHKPWMQAQTTENHEAVDFLKCWWCVLKYLSDNALKNTYQTGCRILYLFSRVQCLG
jgi:hypothetical protein